MQLASGKGDCLPGNKDPFSLLTTAHLRAPPLPGKVEGIAISLDYNNNNSDDDDDGALFFLFIYFIFFFISIDVQWRFTINF